MGAVVVKKLPANSSKETRMVKGYTTLEALVRLERSKDTTSGALVRLDS